MRNLAGKLLLSAAAFFFVSYSGFYLLDRAGPVSTPESARTVLLLAFLAALLGLNNPGNLDLSSPYMLLVFSSSFSVAILLAVVLFAEPALAILAVFSAIYTASVNQRTNPGPVFISAVLVGTAVVLFFSQSVGVSNLVNGYRDFFKSSALDDQFTDSYLTGNDTVFVAPEAIGLFVAIFTFALLRYNSIVNRKYFSDQQPNLDELLDPASEGLENLHKFLTLRSLQRGAQLDPKHSAVDF